MSDDKCKCSLRESMLGDGCRVCQPCTYIAHLEDALKLADGEIAQLEQELAEARKDQARYQWLRSQNWNESNLCVVTKPNLNVKIGACCPSLDFLDSAIDVAIKEQQ